MTPMNTKDFDWDGIIAKAVQDYKDEFTERPEEYVHGDYISFLSQKIKESLESQRQQLLKAVEEKSWTTNKE